MVSEFLYHRSGCLCL